MAAAAFFGCSAAGRGACEQPAARSAATSRNPGPELLLRVTGVLRIGGHECRPPRVGGIHLRGPLWGAFQPGSPLTPTSATW